MSADEDIRISKVRVTNNTDRIWSDRYDGVPMTLKPGESNTVPLDMAAHFFGWAEGVSKLSMLAHMAKRHGWNHGDFVVRNAEVQKRLAEEFFAKFLIEPVTYKLVETDPLDAHRPVPALGSDDDEAEQLREPTSIKDVIAAGMVHPDEEPEAVASRGRGRPPKLGA